MEKITAFLKEAGAYYLGTTDNGNPTIRPFGTAHLFEGKLYIQTGRKKAVYRQMKANPNICICAMSKGTWIRIEAEAVEDPRIEAEKSMLDAYPSLAGMYAPGDGNNVVFYLQKGTATFYSFTADPVVITF